MEAVISIIVLSFFHFVKSATVELIAKPYVQTGEAVKINCSADFVPVGHVAEFMANKVTLTNIRKDQSACFSSKLNKICSNNTCSCAENRRSYMMFFQPDVNSSQDSLSCNMRFTGNDIKVSNDVIIKVIDIPSPSIHISSKFPVISGTTVTFICTAAKTNFKFYFEWNCSKSRIVNNMMSNETVVWSTVDLKVNSTYDGAKCNCSIRARNVDFSVSDFVTLQIKKVPILKLNQKFHCNTSGTVALVCSASGELTTFGFARWIHSVDGKYIRSLVGITETDISILIINDCNFMDGGDYTCSVWNDDGEKTIWANKTTSLHFTGPPVILSKTIEEKDVSEHIGVSFYTRSSLVSVRWQCSDELLNHSIFEQVSMELYIYNTQISLLAYKTSISTSSNQCSRDNVCICISNEYSVHCEKIFSFRGQNGFNAFWVMCAMILCIVAVGISPTLALVLKKKFKTASQSVQLEEVDNSTIDGRYIQVYEADNIATHQYDAAARPYIDLVPHHTTRGDEIALEPYMDSLHYRSASGYEIAGRAYNDLVPYQSSRGYDVTSPEYLDVQPDTDTNSSHSDRYEKVD